MKKTVRQQNPDDFWNKPLQQLFAKIRSSPAGLSNLEAQKRLRLFGPNDVSDYTRTPLWLQFLAHFNNPLVIMLLVASGFSMLTGDYPSFIIISIIVLLSVTIDFFQELKADNGIKALRSRVSIKAYLLRDGEKKILPVTQVIPGDIIYLSAGDLVPADGRLIASKDLFINQSMLTGESYPAEKHAVELLQPTSDISDAINSVFMGTSVISGTAMFVAISTGQATHIGQLARSLAVKPPPTAFEVGMLKFGILIMRVAIVLLFFVLAVNFIFHRPFLQSLLFSLALVVGLTPELLPMIMTITLSRGALILAEQRAIVKHLPAMHNLGAMDVFCTDKTGTLTEAKISLVRHLNPNWEDSESVLELAWLNSYFESGLKGPLDDAILSTGQVDTHLWKKIDEVPFDFNRRCVSVLVDKADKRLLIIKGAPEDILRRCNRFDLEGKVAELNDSKRAECLTKFEALGEEGFRVLGIAYREVEPSHTVAVVADETSMIFAGYAVFLDPPKSDAAKALQDLAEASVQVKVLSGDNERVTRHVVTMLGMSGSPVLIGDEIEAMTDDVLRIQVEKVNVFCRVNPQQKNRIILALQANGRTVGYMGDGINDATALHSADIGISVDSAVDVAKDAADVILLERSLSVINNAVMQGRRTVKNVTKYILMASSANFGNMFSMAGGTLLLPFLPMTAIQILLGNLLYDIAQTGLPFDRVDADEIARPVHWNMSFIKRFMIIIGPIASVFDFLTFYLLLRWFGPNEMFFHTGWFLESLAPQMLTIFCIRTRKRLFTSWPSPIVSILAVGMSACIMILPYTGLGAWFGLVPLPLFYLVFVVVITVAYFSALELVKHWFYQKFGR
jgi:Mg2+-importing ATPase